jgi:hypothetical protein
MGDTHALSEGDAPMARSPSPRSSGATAQRKLRQAREALEGVGVHTEEIGKLNRDGTVTIDPEKLEELKKRLGETVWSTVRFMALNAPFNRRWPIRPA